MPSGHAPAPIALVLCDNVYEEQQGGKSALVGLFNEIRGATFPLVHPRMSVYACVTDVRPGTKLRLEIANRETNEVIFGAEGPSPKEVSPLHVFEMIFNLGSLKFNEPGSFDIRFYGNDAILFQRPFRVIKTSPPGGKK